MKKIMIMIAMILMATMVSTAMAGSQVITLAQREGVYFSLHRDGKFFAVSVYNSTGFERVLLSNLRPPEEDTRILAGKVGHPIWDFSPTEGDDSVVPKVAQWDHWLLSPGERVILFVGISKNKNDEIPINGNFIVLTTSFEDVMLRGSLTMTREDWDATLW